MLNLASIDPVNATFYLAILVLIAGVVLAIFARNAANANQIYAAVGVLFGLLAAGGIGGVFASQVSDNAAEKAAAPAAEAAASEVSEQVEEVLEEPPGGGSSNKQKGGGSAP
jgi:hypothetical protein